MNDKSEIPELGNKVEFQDKGCFVCGEKNPIGLHLHFELDHENHRAISTVTFGMEHQGWDGVVHGGLLASVLDDAMAYAVMTTGHLALTTRMCVTYRRAVMVGETIHLEGHVEVLKSRVAEVKAIAYKLGHDGDKIIMVESEGTYFLDKPKV